MDKNADLSSLIKSLIQHFGSPESVAKHLSALPQMVETTEKPSSSQAPAEVPGETITPAPSPKGSPKRSTNEFSVGTDVAPISLQMVETPINPEPISTVAPLEIFHSPKMAPQAGPSLKVDEELKKGKSLFKNPTVQAAPEKSTVPSSLARIGEIAKEALLDLASQPGSDVDKASVVAEEEFADVGDKPTSMDVDETERIPDVDQDVDPEESTYVIDVETFVLDKKSGKRKVCMASLRRSSRSKSTRVIPSTLNLPSREDSVVGPTSKPTVLKPKVEHSPTSKSGKVEVSKSYSTHFYTREANNALKVLAARKFYNDRRADKDFFSKFKLDVLLQDRGMWGNVINIFGYDAEIVREFYVNLMPEAFDSKSVKYGKIFVRGKVFNFSPSVINKACYTADTNTADVEIDDDEMTRELTGGKLKSTGGSMLLFPSFIYNLLVKKGLEEREEVVLVEEKNLLEFSKTLLTPDRIKDLPYEPPRTGPHYSPQPDDKAGSAEAEIDKYGEAEDVDYTTGPDVDLDVANI
ncbi:uncharacterized protein LOC130994193 [Salvia miltiorrhiza]|uniref:uncharacterized protein LOC130994193 n=1 Tax=Salvia miltiorrhiza TaxID=226208 RepID=UPI0025AD6722|nr:uncharacterized protein LOC130994193 [Salvia miltiorrhiza]